MQRDRNDAQLIVCARLQRKQEKKMAEKLQKQRCLSLKTVTTSNKTLLKSIKTKKLRFMGVGQFVTWCFLCKKKFDSELDERCDRFSTMFSDVAFVSEKHFIVPLKSPQTAASGAPASHQDKAWRCSPVSRKCHEHSCTHTHPLNPLFLKPSTIKHILFVL